MAALTVQNIAKTGLVASYGSAAGSGDVNVGYSGVTSVTVAALRLPPAIS